MNGEVERKQMFNSPLPAPYPWPLYKPTQQDEIQYFCNPWPVPAYS